MRLYLSFALALSSLVSMQAQDRGKSSQTAAPVIKPDSSGSSLNALVLRIRDADSNGSSSNALAFRTGDGGSSGSSSGPLVVRIRDKCDPATFNAAVGAGTCVGDGNVTFAEFNAELAEDQKVGDWRFNPDQTGATLGQQVQLESRGGELHTFTYVQKFGGGIIAPLNTASGNPIPAPECGKADPSDANTIIPSDKFFRDRVFAGTNRTGPRLYNGEQKFQCCIHPWMRLTVTVTGK